MRHIRDLFDLTDRTALITGGATGLGYQMATALAEAGAAVALASRREELCREQAEALAKSTGARTLGLRLDVGVKAEAEAAVEAVVRAWDQIDILVNNSGVTGPGDTVALSEEVWRDTLDKNLTGAFYCAQAAGRHMVARRRGCIVNTTSVYASLGTDGRLYVDPSQPPLENVAYCAAKGGTLNLTRGLATAWARHGVRVNCISPGAFIVERLAKRLGDRKDEMIRRWSDRTPLGRVGEDDDLKGAVVFLASDASKYVTGAEIVVDGGWSIW
jgi:gluconate 5-dehydrogenase